MRKFRRTLKPACIFLVFLLLLTSSFPRDVSAAMIGTQKLMKPGHDMKTHDYLQELIARENVQKVLVSWGIHPDEAKARIDSLTDDEIVLLAAKIDNLPEGGDATGFIVVCAAVILLVFIIVEYTSEVKMFPQLHFGD